LFVSQLFGNSLKNLKFVMVDIPGFDEIGTKRIAENTKDTQILSSVYVFITSFDDYSKEASTMKLISLLSNDSGKHRRYCNEINKELKCISFYILKY